MGRALSEGLGAIEGFVVVALVDLHPPTNLLQGAFVTSLDELDASTVDVVVDFSSPDGVVTSATWCSAHGVDLVVGATGLSSSQRDLLRGASATIGVVVASNFSIGAVLAEHFAALAAPYFDGVEIIELHHDRKVDAPSGTSIAAARTIAAARRAAGKSPLVDPTTRETIAGARGVDALDGVRIHSVRLPGLVAHEEIHFGGPGEGLTIRHDSFDRSSFVQGVALAILALDSTPRFLDGIGSLVG